MGRTLGSDDKAHRKRRCMTESEKVQARRRREQKKKEDKRQGKAIGMFIAKGTAKPPPKQIPPPLATQQHPEPPPEDDEEKQSGLMEEEDKSKDDSDDIESSSSQSSEASKEEKVPHTTATESDIEEEEQIIENPPGLIERRDFIPASIAGTVTYDLQENDDMSVYDDDMDEEEEAKELEQDIDERSPMHIYLQAVHSRLQTETSSTSMVMEKWLLKFLIEHNWRIPSFRAEFLCRRLKISHTFSEIAYYRDIVVWLPDIQYSVMPPCPNGCGTQCSPHGWRENHYGRKIVSLYSHYYVTSRRYKCSNCEALTIAQKKVAEGVQRRGGNIASYKPLTYTFMGYNAQSRELLPYGLGDCFPCFFTHRCGVDMGLIDLMRPLFSFGVRPNQLHDILLELATKHHHQEWQKREHDLIRKRQSINRDRYKNVGMFGEFGDRTTYDGYVPSRQYLTHAFKLYSASIKSHMDREVKKRGAQFLRWDVSYKEAKKLCQYKSNALFKGLVTATNELGEVRMQFHIVTDGHDQMVGALTEFKETVALYGQQQPNFLFTDKPVDDYNFFRSQLPSLVHTENELNMNAPEADGLPCGTVIHDCDVDLNNDVHFCDSAQSLKPVICALLLHLRSLPTNQRVVGLDEEHEFGSKIQYPPKGRDRIAMIQIAYCTESGSKCILFQCRNQKQLPDCLLQLFCDTSITYVGRRIKNDIDNIGEDFSIRDSASKMRFIDLARMSKNRGKSKYATDSLQLLVLTILGENLGKDKSVRCSKWAKKVITEEQKKYAALDAIKSLEVYEKLEGMDDLTARLASSEARRGTIADVVGRFGMAGTDSLSTICAVATILQGVTWTPPTGIKMKQTKFESRVVEIKTDRLFAPGLIIPGYFREVSVIGNQQQKKVKKKVSLGELSATTGDTFLVQLPLTMLKRHDPGALQEVLHNHRLGVDDQSVLGAAEEQENVWKAGESGESCSDQNENDDQEASEARKEMTADDIAMLQYLHEVAEECRPIGENDPHVKLQKPPDKIVDCFRSVLGDPWHYMDRPKVPVKHEFKKAYFVALSEAWFAWEPIKLEKVRKKLLESGMTEKEVESKMYFDTDFFLNSVPRVVLPPSQLYWRIRIVFATFGSKMDSESGKPLFNDRAWKKANNVLKEILKGYASDPPGVALYLKRLDRNGEPMTNKFDLEQYYCLRGTGLTEVHHKQMVQSIGTWSTGIEMSDAVRQEHRHRYNHRMAERRRASFPKIGHFDTWRIDALQLLVEYNHNVQIYPTWSNTADFNDTSESFGTVPLQCNDLTDAVDNLIITEAVLSKLSREQKYLANQQKVTLPFTPVVTREERQAYKKMLLDIPGIAKDMDDWALRWLEYVDGSTIFPKLPVYLRNYHEKFLLNSRISEAVKGIDDKVALLRSLNGRLQPQPENALIGDEENGNEEVSAEIDEQQTVPKHTQQQKRIRTTWMPPAHLPLLPIAPTHQHGVIQHVGGVQIGISAAASYPTVAKVPPRKAGQRSGDRKKRAVRRCKRCMRHEGSNSTICKGRTPKAGQEGCQYFSADGTSKS